MSDKEDDNPPSVENGGESEDNAAESGDESGDEVALAPSQSEAEAKKAQYELSERETLEENDMSRMRLEEWPAMNKLKEGEWLNLDNNKLKSWLSPVDLPKLDFLKALHIDKNRLSNIPLEIRMLTNLQSLSLAQNKIANIPTSIGGLTNLVELNLSSNKIEVVPEEIGRCVKLEELYLENNEIHTLANDICLLTNLQRLSLMKNKLESLAPAIVLLPKLSIDHFRVDRNPLSAYPSKVRQRKELLWKYLHVLLEGEEEWARMKLLVVGKENTGKTSLVKGLIGTRNWEGSKASIGSGKSKRTNATDGIDVHDWKSSEGENIMVSIWDFAGQDLYYTTHQFFLGQQTLYLLLFNINIDLTETKITYWLNSIQSKAPGATVFIGGTHVDLVQLQQGETLGDHLARKSVLVEEHFNEWADSLPPGTALVVEPCRWTVPPLFFWPVSGVTGKGVFELGHRLTEMVRFNKTVVPKKTIGLMSTVISSRELHKPPVVEWESVVERWGRRYGFTKKELGDAIRLLHVWGVLLHYDSEDNPILRERVIINPKFLTDVFRTVLSFRFKIANKDGKVTKQDLWDRWTADNVPQALYPFLASLLETFELFYQERRTDSKSMFIIPSQIMKKFNPKWWPAQYNGRQAGRVYTLDFFPHGLFSRLFVQLARISKEVTYWTNGLIIEKDGQLAKLELSGRGAQMQHESEESSSGSGGVSELLHNELDRFKGKITVIARGDRCMEMLVNVHFIVEELIKNWYVGTWLRLDVTLLYWPPGNASVQEGDELRFSRTKALHAHLVHGAKMVESEGTNAMNVEVEELLPELFRKEVDPVTACERQVARVELLGESSAGGPFGDVSLARWHSAMEVLLHEISLDDKSGWRLNESLSADEFWEQLGKLSKIRHKNLEHILHIYREAGCMLTPFNRKGSLDDVLDEDADPVSLAIAVRIGLDLGRALNHLHSEHSNVEVLHGDLDPGYVQVVNLDADADVCVRLAGAGIATLVRKATAPKKSKKKKSSKKSKKSKDYVLESELRRYGKIMAMLASIAIEHGETATFASIAKEIEKQKISVKACIEKLESLLKKLPRSAETTADQSKDDESAAAEAEEE